MNCGAGAIHFLPVKLRREEVLRFLSYPEGEWPRQGIATLLDEVLAEARALIQARGVFREWPVDRAQEVGLQPIEAAGLVLGLVTAGDGLERRASQLMEDGETTRALLFDAAGSAAAEGAADLLGGIIANDQGHSGEGTVSCRISPGYGNWPLLAQPALFELLPHAELGVELFPSLLMVPRKSISFAMWLGADNRPIAGLAGCSHCPLTGCRYRRKDDHR